MERSIPMEKGHKMNGLESFKLSKARYLELVQHVKSIATILNPGGEIPPLSGGECPPVFDIVIEGPEDDRKPYLKFRARRGSDYWIHNDTDQKATLEFWDPDWQHFDAAKKELDLDTQEGKPPTIEVAPNETGRFKVGESELGQEKQIIKVQIKLESGLEGGTGNGPEMEIDDP